MMRLSSRQWALVLMLVVLALGPSFALGAGMPPKIVPCDGVHCTVCSIADLAQNILNSAIFIAVFLAAFLFAFAGVQMLISPTNPGQRQKASALFYNVVIGFIIILAAWLIVNAVMGILFDGRGRLPWNQIC